jgi:hypothetical protein
MAAVKKTVKKIVTDGTTQVVKSRNSSKEQKIVKRIDNVILNPKATASWLIDNTTLTFAQIAKFLGMHELEVQAIENDVVNKIRSLSPVGIYLSQEEIDRCSQDASADLKMMENVFSSLGIKKPKTKKYIPLLQRRSRLDAILWLTSFAPQLTDKQISKLIGSTQHTVMAIRSKAYKRLQDLTPKDPVILGLCSQKALDLLIATTAK